MNRLAVFGLVAALAFSLADPASAQGEAPYLIEGTTPLPTYVRDAVNAWLAVDAPASPAPYYAPTYYKDKYAYAWVSLVALDLDSEDAEWHFIEDDGGPSVVRWTGTLKVYDDGTVQPFQPGGGAQARAGGALFSVSTAAGGGPYVQFPWQGGKGAIYGIRGVHGEGDYSTSGMYAVDLLSGSDLGPGASNDTVYASDAGTVDYICDDGTTVAVRTYNDTTEDYFIYAHLLDNAALEIDAEFARGQSIGHLKHGSFDDSCGWAEQQDDHWHNHWMFTPASNAFQSEGCILTITDQKWHCGVSEVIGTGGWLISSGYTSGSTGSTGTHDPGRTDNRIGIESSLWDNILVALAFIIDPFWKNVPEHQGLTFLITLKNAIQLFFRLLYVFAHGNINLWPVIYTLGIILPIRFVLSALWLGAFALKAVKSLVPIT